MLLCFVLAAVAIAEVAGAERPLVYLRERLAVLVVMAVAGIALIAAPMLLTMQFAALSNRPAITLDHAVLGSLHPAGLAQLVVADIFGSHRADYWGPNGATEPLVALTDDSFNYLFVGSVPVILLLWFGIAGGGAFRRGRMLLAATAALALRLCARPLHAGVRVGFRLGAGREPVPPPGRRQLRLRCDARADLRRAARRLHPRGRAARAALASVAVALAALAVVASGVMFSGRDRSFRRCACRGAEERADSRARRS